MIEKFVGAYSNFTHYKLDIDASRISTHAMSVEGMAS